jgi:hypothetical protein
MQHSPLLGVINLKPSEHLSYPIKDFDFLSNLLKLLKALSIDFGMSEVQDHFIIERSPKKAVSILVLEQLSQVKA